MLAAQEPSRGKCESPLISPLVTEPARLRFPAGQQGCIRSVGGGGSIPLKTLGWIRFVGGAGGSRFQTTLMVEMGQAEVSCILE